MAAKAIVGMTAQAMRQLKFTLIYVKIIGEIAAAIPLQKPHRVRLSAEFASPVLEIINGMHGEKIAAPNPCISRRVRTL
jgi:hypothetical protein